MKKLLVLLVMLVALSSTLYSQMNFPLQVGNKFVYYHTWYHWSLNGTYSGSEKVANSVLKDSTFNNHKYYYTSYDNWIRFDSLTQSIYRFDESNSCPYYYKEKLIDSLAMVSGTTNSCANKIFFGSRNDTLFGVIGLTRVYKINIAIPFIYQNYNTNFGVTKYYSHYVVGSTEDLETSIMVGCYINGVLYGDTVLTKVKQISTEVPTLFSLSQNYPNPFNSMCNVQFSMRNAGDVRLVVYDIQGREVQTLVNESLKPGTYEAAFDGSSLNSGVYFYKISAGEFSETKKMLLVK
ncbi:MAG TPA: T9SS type A sorting domain-containing protein [Ignavibacteria bacterium]